MRGDEGSPGAGRGGVGRRAVALFFLLFQFYSCFLALYTLEGAVSKGLVWKLGILAVVPLVYTVGFFRWPWDFFRLFPWLVRLDVDGSGLRSGAFRIDWDDLERVNFGLWFWSRYPSLTLVSGKKPDSFWNINLSTPKIALPLSVTVHADLIPELRSRRPDIPIPDWALSSERSRMVRARVAAVAVFLLGVAQLFLLHKAVSAVSSGAFLFSQIFGMLLLVPASIAPVVCFEDEGEPFPLLFQRGVVGGGGIAFFLGVYSFYLFSPPAWTLSALGAFCAISAAFGTLALILVFHRGRIPAAFPRGACVFLAVSAVGSFLAFKAPLARTMNFSASFGDNSPLFVWSVDGRYLADSSSTSGRYRRFLIDVASAEEIPMPSHPAGDVVIRIGHGKVVRRVFASGGNMGLFLFDIRTRVESKIDENARIVLSRLAPVSPGGRLVWFSFSSKKKDALPEVRVMGLEDGVAGKLSWVLPKGIVWRCADWLDDGNLVLRGAEAERPDGPWRLALARYDTRSGKTVLSKTELSADRWYPLPGFKRAFALTKVPVPGDSYPRRVVRYVDLVTGRVISNLSGGAVPSWASGHWAFRTVETGCSGSELRRFDLETGREDVLAKVPGEWLLSGVSRDGRYALFALDSLITFATFHLFDLETKEWREVALPGLAGYASEPGELVLIDPRFSIWSPTADAAVLESMEFHLGRRSVRFKTRVFSVDGVRFAPSGEKRNR